MKKIRFLLALFWIVFGLFPSAVAAQPVRDFYRDLGIMPGTSFEEELKEAYQRAKERLLSGPGQSLEAQERLTELQKSYDILRDPKLRAEYDKSLKEAGFQKEPNYYKILGVLSDSSPAQIMRAYRQIRQKVHPDKQRDRSLMAMATRRFQELKEAHEVLSDPMRRLMHDHQLKRFSGNILPHFKPAERGVSPGKGEEMDAGRETPSGKRAVGPREEGINLSRFRAEAMPEEEDYALYWWNEEVFKLAKELEAGGEADIKEAVEWYRTLAVEGHVEAARRLAPLLENIDMEEALYRYDQGSIGDSDGSFSRVAAFRQAQIYLKGVYEGNEAVIPKDEERASLLFERAFKLGISHLAIVREYDINRNYEKAMEWREKGGEKPQDGKNLKQNTGMEPVQQQPDFPVHRAVLRSKSEAFIMRELRSIKNQKNNINWNAYNSAGETALSLAAWKFYNSEVVRFLIEEAGADPTIPDANGLLPIHQALLAELEVSVSDKTVNQVMKPGLRKTLYALRQTWTSRVLEVKHIHYGKTPLEIALGHSMAGAENQNYRMEDMYIDFILSVIEDKGVSYLTSEEFDRIISFAHQRGYQRTVNWLRRGKDSLSKQTSVKESLPPNGFLFRLVERCRFVFSLPSGANPN